MGTLLCITHHVHGKNMHHPIQCQCGALKGELTRTGRELRCVCYCKDCQAYARFLNREADVLDSDGGSDVIQTSPSQLRFSQGLHHLACMRLTDKGMLRWYASCCNTPIGNTATSHKMPFVGLLHNCLASTPEALTAAFGPVIIYVNGKSSPSNPKPQDKGLLKAIARVALMMLRARLNGSYKQAAFFDADTGRPILTPKVLSSAERQQLAEPV